MQDRDVKIDFQTFALSLASSAMVHLGRVPDPTGQSPEINLGMARQTIAILAMLRDKTHGNLNDTESTILERVLHDLRVACVEETRRRAS